MIITIVFFEGECEIIFVVIFHKNKIYKQITFPKYILNNEF